MIRALFWALMLMLTGSAALALTGMQWIARVYPDGSVGFNKLIYTTVDLVEMEISEVDGAIYRSSENGMSKLDENGDWVDGWSLPAFHRTKRHDVSVDNCLWIPGTEKTSDEGLYKYTSSGSYVKGIEDFRPVSAAAEGTDLVWAGVKEQAPITMPGLHRFTSEGSRNLYLDEYRASYLAVIEIDGSIWFTSVMPPTYDVVKVDASGTELFLTSSYIYPYDCQSDKISGCLWFIEGGTESLVKLDAAGGEVFKDSSYTDIARIDVNESDGSVWVAANGKGALVHLSAGGEELLALPFEAEMLHLAVDQRDGSCVVISDGNGLGDLNVQPSSVGRIKAMFAGEGPTSGAGKGVHGEGKRDVPIYEHPWYGYPP